LVQPNQLQPAIKVPFAGNFFVVAAFAFQHAGLCRIGCDLRRLCNDGQPPNADKDGIAMHDRHSAIATRQALLPCGSDGKAQLPINARIRIGKKLAQMVDPILAEPVPNRFLELLDQLEREENMQSAGLHAYAEGDA
jgi:Anti-sigma factor NepR